MIFTLYVQSPPSGGVNQILFSVAMLFPAVTSKVSVSTIVLFRYALASTSSISKNAFEVTSKSILLLSSKLSPSLSKFSIAAISTSAGSVISPA